MLTGCAGATSLPTQFPTVVEATVSSTPVPTTLTPTVQATPTVTQTITPEPSDTQTPTQTLTPAPTRTPTQTSTTIPKLAAQLLKIWTYPSSKTKYGGNERFGVAIYLKNTGSETWESGYKLKLVKHVGVGEVTVQPEMDLTVEVPPGGKVEFDLWAFGSEHYGPHTWTFQLYSQYGTPVPGSQASYSFTSI